MEFMQVIVRTRPSARGNNSTQLQYDPEQPTILKFGPEDADQKIFAFNKIFDSDATQPAVFSSLTRIVEGVPLGINGTIFAYGQTGSGKTHTMLGNASVHGFIHDDVARGIIPRSADFLFQLLEKEKESLGDRFSFTVSCSFVELYNEVFYDLISTTQNSSVTIRSDKNKSVKLEGASRVEVGSAHEVMLVLQQGWNGRTVAETAMNRESSRSHALLIIDVFMQKNDNGVVKSMSSRLNLVDLAGSERQSQTKSAGARLMEACNINKSLTVFGRVIRDLSTGKAKHISYRDSKLTHVLSDSLGGNCRTAVVVNIHPDSEFSAETLSTLQFANSCSMVKNHATSNLRVGGASVMALQAELVKVTRERDEAVADKEKEMRAEMDVLESSCDEWRQKAREQELQLSIAATEMQTLRVLAKRRNMTDQDLTEAARHSANSVLELWKPENITSVAELDVFELSRKLRMAEEKIARLEDEQRANRRFSNTESSFLAGSPLRNANQSMNSTVMQTPDARRKNRRRTGVFTPADQDFARNASMRAPTVSLFADDDMTGDKENASQQVPLENAAANLSIKECAAGESLHAELAEKQNEIDELSEQNAVLKQIFEDAQSTMADLEASHQNRCAILSEEISKARNGNDDLARQMHAKENEILSLEKALKERSTHIESLTNDLQVEIRKSHSLEAEVNEMRSQLSDAQNNLLLLANEKEVEMAQEKERVAAMVEELIANKRDAVVKEGESTEQNAVLRGKIAEMKLEHQDELNKQEAAVAVLNQQLDVLVVENQQSMDLVSSLRRELAERADSVEHHKSEIARVKELHAMDLSSLKNEYEYVTARLESELDKVRRDLSVEKESARAARLSREEFIQSTDEKLAEISHLLAKEEAENEALKDALQQKENEAESKEREIKRKEKELRDRERHFDEKMAELKSTFKSKETLAAREKEMAKAALDDANAAYERVQAQCKATTSEKEVALRERDDIHRRFHDLSKALDDTIAKHAAEAELMAGNHNQQSKIRYITNMKEQLGEKTKEIDLLRTKLDKRDAEIRALKKGSVATTSGNNPAVSSRVTRSRASAIQ